MSHVLVLFTSVALWRTVNNSLLDLSMSLAIFILSCVPLLYLVLLEMKRLNLCLVSLIILGPVAALYLLLFPLCLFQGRDPKFLLLLFNFSPSLLNLFPSCYFLAPNLSDVMAELWFFQPDVICFGSILEKIELTIMAWNGIASVLLTLI